MIFLLSWSTNYPLTLIPYLVDFNSLCEIKVPILRQLGHDLVLMLLESLLLVILDRLRCIIKVAEFPWSWSFFLLFFLLSLRRWLIPLSRLKPKESGSSASLELYFLNDSIQ